MFFDSTIKLLDTYQTNLGGEPPPNYNGDLLSEVRERLQMLSILYEKVHEVETIAMSLIPQSFGLAFEYFGYDAEGKLRIKRTPTEEEGHRLREYMAQQNAATLEMKMYLEAFYYFAARIRKILKSKEEPLPLLRSFESKGVRDVRNHLIEHPQVLTPACGYGGQEGPKLKGVHYPGQEDVIKDQGFRKNALEFKENLEKVLNKALRRHVSNGNHHLNSGQNIVDK